MRILCLHGVGGPNSRRGWQSEWKECVRAALRRARREAVADFEFLDYDHIFDRYRLDAGDAWTAVRRLLDSGATQIWRRAAGQEGLFDGFSETIRWTAGMVVQWVENADLREELRRTVLKALRRLRPDAILAHSLGSLIGYDCLTHPEGRGALDGGSFVSLGSQIGNPFVVGNLFAGRIQPIPGALWFHLFNRWDDVFTSRIGLESPWFTEIDTPFGDWGSLDHDAVQYLGHEQTTSRMWAVLPESAERPASPGMQRPSPPAREPAAKALLVGIDEYPDPRIRLKGSVNDVFLVSSLLQEQGFPPEQIRLLVNQRATAAAIRERLKWLFHDARSGDRLVFHFSGHGVKLPGYNAETVIDRIYECLAPYDFDGSLDSAVTDEQVYSGYVHLPYDVRVVMILDCCHAGGQARASGSVRGIEAPEDIRHRALRWDPQRGLWVARHLAPLTSEAAGDEERNPRFGGEQGATFRLGRALAVRPLPEPEFRRRRSARNHLGPYMPVVLQACSCDEQAFEYQHGGSTYGAFTFSLAHCLRRLLQKPGSGAAGRPTLPRVMQAVREVLRRDLNLNQTADADGPHEVLEGVFPLLQ